MQQVNHLKMFFLTDNDAYLYILKCIVIKRCCKILKKCFIIWKDLLACEFKPQNYIFQVARDGLHFAIFNNLFTKMVMSYF